MIVFILIIGSIYLNAYKGTKKIREESKKLSKEERKQLRKTLSGNLFGWAATIELPKWIGGIGNILTIIAIIGMSTIAIFSVWMFIKTY